MFVKKLVSLKSLLLLAITCLNYHLPAQPNDLSTRTEFTGSNKQKRAITDDTIITVSREQLDEALLTTTRPQKKRVLMMIARNLEKVAPDVANLVHACPTCLNTYCATEIEQNKLLEEIVQVVTPLLEKLDFTQIRTPDLMVLLIGRDKKICNLIVELLRTSFDQVHTKIIKELLNQYAYGKKPSFSKEEQDPSTGLITRTELNDTGYITIRLLSDKQEVGRTILSNANYMEILQVNPAYRKQGYGKRLIAKAIAHCKAHKSPTMQWVASAFNAYGSAENGLSQPDLVAFYRRCGGVPNSTGYFTLDLTQPAAPALA